MSRGTSSSVLIPAIFFTGCLILTAGCSGGSAPDVTGNSKPASCFDIKKFGVLHVESFDGEKAVCRLELSPPPGFEFVDKTGKRLPYHPYVLVKQN